MQFCEDCKKITNNNCEKHFTQECEHNFVFSGKVIEATEDNYIYHPVGYSVCKKCGEVRKNNL